MKVRKKKRWSLWFLIVVLSMVVIRPLTAFSSGTQSLVFVAGNPNLYPIEYYDTKEKQFKGVIPELLQRFSAESQYEIQYLDTGRKDRRQRQYKNKQAELISGCVPEDGFSEHVWQDGIFILQTEKDGALTEYRVLFSEIADGKLKQDLAAFIAELPEARQNALLISAAQHKEQIQVSALIWTAVLSALPFLLAILILLWRFRKKQRALRQKLDTDDVTGAGNYEAFSRYYGQLISEKKRILYSLVYFHTDTDRLRYLCGSQETNDFLRYLAVTFRQNIAETDILARISDMGFAILKLTASQAETEQWIRSVFEQIQLCGIPSAETFSASVSAGIYPLRANDSDPHTIIFNAEQSSIYARTHHMKYAVYSNEITSVYAEEWQLEQRIPQALEKEEFVLYLHFFVDTNTHKIVGGESLSRWQHPDWGLIMPERYIPLMERDNSITGLDYYVLKQVCRFLDELQSQGADDFFVSCNFSRNTFMDPQFVDKCIDIISPFSFSREMLIFEMTKNEIETDSQIIFQNAMRMKNYGVSIVLDDFGRSGVFFLDLERYHFDGLKLDKSLIDHLATKEGEIILNGIIGIGHQLGMTVLAKGVETEEQVQKLKKLHCGALQGYYFYHPLPLPEVKQIYLQQIEDKGI